MKPNNDTFDFSSVGKRMPYRTPEGFFEANKQRLMEEVATAQKAAEASSLAAETAMAEKKPRKEILTLNRSRHWRGMVIGAAATIALLVASYGIVRWAITAESIYPADVSLAYADDGEDWSDFADADIFLDCWE